MDAIEFLDKEWTLTGTQCWLKDKDNNTIDCSPIYDVMDKYVKHKAASNSKAIDELIKHYKKEFKKYPAVCFCDEIIKAISEI